MKILVADDHELFRRGLISFLEDMEDNITILEAEDYKQTFAAIESNSPLDLVIVDLDMPDMSWEDGLNQIHQLLGPEGKYIIISASDDVQSVRKSLELGASGYVSKRSNPKILENAIQLVLNGGIYLPHDILKNVISSPSPTAKDKVNGLTERQEEVLKFVASGMSNKQIAYELGVTESTIKLHINSLLKALGANNRTQAVINAQKLGVI